MVAMQMTFGNCEQSTPHGGPPFHYWKKGFGFGHSRGPGQGNVLHPAAPVQLRFSPGGDRALASNQFWRTKNEIGSASGFGIGERPDLYTQEPTAPPDNYGDVSTNLKNVKRNSIRSGIKLKPRFPSMEEKYRDLSWPKSGPGPSKYNISDNPERGTSYSFGLRPEFSGEFKEQSAKPGAGDYETRRVPGTNSPIEYGTLYNISMRGKVRQFALGEASPGPARYNVKGELEGYGLWGKIENIKGPPTGYWQHSVHQTSSSPPARLKRNRSCPS